MRQKNYGIYIYLAKCKNNNGEKNKKNGLLQYSKKEKKIFNLQSFSPCLYCKKINHPQKRCWWRLNSKGYKRGQLRHTEKICKSHHQQQGDVNIVEGQHEDREEQQRSDHSSNERQNLILLYHDEEWAYY